MPVFVKFASTLLEFFDPTLTLNKFPIAGVMGAHEASSFARYFKRAITFSGNCKITLFFFIVSILNKTGYSHFFIFGKEIQFRKIFF